MKKNKFLVLLSTLGVFAFSTVLISFAADNIPNGWIKTGSAAKDYEVGIDKKYIGNNSTYISSVADNQNGFGTLMQTIPAKKYLGKRLKMSALVKSENVTGWAGLWMRIDGNDKKMLGFDNMENRAITGSTVWKKYDVVLDVPKESKFIAFGILLSGKGKAWLDDVAFETVNKSVKTTDMNLQIKEDPVNLNFDN